MPVANRNAPTIKIAIADDEGMPTSGAAQAKVPRLPSSVDSTSLRIILARPTSASLAVKSRDSRMLALFRSKCTICVLGDGQTIGTQDHTGGGHRHGGVMPARLSPRYVDAIEKYNDSTTICFSP